MQMAKKKPTIKLEPSIGPGSPAARNHGSRNSTTNIPKPPAHSDPSSVADAGVEFLKRGCRSVGFEAPASVAHLGEGVMITSDGLEWLGSQILFVNDTLCQITGYSANVLVGQTPRILQGDGSDRETLNWIKSELAAGRSCRTELVNCRKDGTTYDAELFITPLFDAAGCHTHFVAIYRDVTERKLAENDLRRLSKVFTDSANAIFIKDLDGCISELNATAEREYGWTRSELLGKSIKMLVAPDEHARHQELMARCLRGEPVRGIEIGRLTKSGEVLPVLLTLSLLTDETGKPTGIASISENISERKRSEAALREREEQLRAVLNTAADAIITIDLYGIINNVNPAVEPMFGYTQAQLLGQNIKILMPKPYCDEHDGYLARYQETREPHIIGIGREVVGRRKDGSTFPVSLAVSEVDHLGLYTGIIRDMSRLRETEKHVLEIAAEEQRRIGQELHDGMGQELTGLSLFAGTLDGIIQDARRREIDGRAVHLFEAVDFQRLEQTSQRLLRGLTEANRHVHALSHGIMPVQIDSEGLRAALEELAAATDAQDNISCRFECTGPVAVPSNTTASHLFRIAQEALNNALRHGQANQIKISLSQQNGQVTLQVSDNGIGFNPVLSRVGSPAGGLGLRIMVYRADAIGGVLQIERQGEGGMLVKCTVFIGGGNRE